MDKPKLEISRLARLSKRMLRVKPEHLDMGAWGYRTPRCGTIGCLLGHAGLIPEFRALGLRTDLKDGVVTYKNFSGFDAGAEFFGLADKTASMLFDPIRYSVEDETPKLIAARIDTLINAGEKTFTEMVNSVASWTNPGDQHEN